MIKIVIEVTDSNAAIRLSSEDVTMDTSEDEMAYAATIYRAITAFVRNLDVETLNKLVNINDVADTIILLQTAAVARELSKKLASKGELN